MATVNWQKAVGGPQGTVLRHRDGCIVISSYLDGDETVLLTLPLSCLQDLVVIQAPASDLELEPLTINYDGNGHDGT